MSVMSRLDELEQELYEKGVLELNKSDWLTPTTKSWFSNTLKPEDYNGLFNGIKLDIKETDTNVIIKYNKENVADVYNASMNGLKNSLNDVVQILLEDKLNELEQQLFDNKKLVISKEKSYWKDCKYYLAETLSGDYLGILRGVPVNIEENDTEIIFTI